MKVKALEDVKLAIRNPYAWPGGYPRYTVLADGELLCATCARENYKLIAHSTAKMYNDGWTAVGSMVLYEHEGDMPTICVHCGKELAAAYE